MSIEINWESLTSGSDGEALAETIREFIHDRFQQVTLPKFIRSVHVHSFDFGSIPPELDLKDICDPLQDFYEGQDGDEDEDDAEDGGTPAERASGREAVAPSPTAAMRQQTIPRSGSPLPRTQRPRPRLDTRSSAQAPLSALAHNEAVSSFLSRSSTPGIPGGTSNVNNYFHLPLSAGLSGTAQTPFAAVAGAHGWPDRYQGGMSSQHPQDTPERQQYFNNLSPALENRSSPLPSRSHRRNSSSFQNIPSSPLHPSDAADALPSSSPPPSPLQAAPETSVNDVQIVAHLRYSGDIKLTLTADILLDYPMPSFVGIPLQLRVTGLSFDGVAILAYIKHKAHFCFLAPEDAEALIGSNPRSPLSPPIGPGPFPASGDGQQSPRPREKEQAGARPGGLDADTDAKKPVGGLFEEIKVESEIGQKVGHKPVLKNVGKVEKFVLEQVRRIFETEFVYPSFWTFLV